MAVVAIGALNRLTQTEEEDTSVQAQCADSCRAAHARSHPSLNI